MYRLQCRLQVSLAAEGRPALTPAAAYGKTAHAVMTPLVIAEVGAEVGGAEEGGVEEEEEEAGRLGEEEEHQEVLLPCLSKHQHIRYYV